MCSNAASTAYAISAARSHSSAAARSASRSRFVLGLITNSVVSVNRLDADRSRSTAQLSCRSRRTTVSITMSGVPNSPGITSATPRAPAISGLAAFPSLSANGVYHTKLDRWITYDASPFPPSSPASSEMNLNCRAGRSHALGTCVYRRSSRGSKLTTYAPCPSKSIFTSRPSASWIARASARSSGVCAIRPNHDPRWCHPVTSAP